MRIILTALTLAFSTASHAADRAGRTPDPHPVGFEVIATADHARRDLTDDDRYGPRPLEIGIWYPAADGAEGPPPDPAPYAATRSMADARRAEGRFPLVLYAAAQGGGGYGNALLCEILASRGFIVATVASKGPYGSDMPFNDAGAEAQLRDLEFVYGTLHDYPHVEHANVSLFGFSFGGLNMVPFAVRHRGVRAMVALDGSIPPGYDIIRRFAFLQPAELRTPLLAFLGDKTDAAAFEPFLAGSPLADVLLFQTSGLIHFDFSSQNLAASDRPQAVWDTYRTMTELTVAFIDQHARGGDAFERAREQVPADMFPAVTERPGRDGPRIGRDAFIPYAKAEGLDAARAVFDEARREFPDYRLFDYDAFRDVGFALMLREDYGEAVKAFRILIEAYPEKADSHRRLGEALMMAGQYAEARPILERGLEIDPDSPALHDILRILSGKEGAR